MQIESIYKSFPIIDCGEHILRPILEKDREQLFNIYSNEEVLKYQASKVFTSIEEADKAIERFRNSYESQNFVKWCIANKTNDEMIGLMSLHHIDSKNKNAQIGYILKRDLWNKGIMCKIAMNYITYLFDIVELEKIEVSIHPENQGSLRLAEKLGFEREGLRRHCILSPVTNLYEDRVLMGLFKDRTLDA